MNMLLKIAIFSLKLLINYLIRANLLVFDIIKFKITKLKIISIRLDENKLVLNIKTVICGFSGNYLKYYKHSYSHNWQSKPSKGFTLLELIITVTILAIVITIAFPAILRQLANMEAKRIKYEIINTLSVAKAESSIRHQDLLICLSNGNGRCNRNSDKFLLLFVDKNRNNNFDANSDLLLEKRNLSPKYGMMRLRVGNNRHYTKFWGNSSKPRGHFGHIKYCPTSIYSQAMYQVSFNQVGVIKYKPNNTHDTDCDN